MWFNQKGLPEEDDIVLCKVTKILPNAVFVELLERKRTGIIHISEVSPGRIRNLRDYVSVGRQIVCKVLRVNKEKGFIDLSLRRVNSHQRQEKLAQIKQELTAEQVIKNLAKKLKKKPEVLYKTISTAIFKEYSHIYLALKDAVAKEVTLEELGIEKKLAQELLEAAAERFKPQKVMIQGEVSLQTYDSQGVEKVKKTLVAMQKVSDTIELHYLGGGRYRLRIEDFEYKAAEKTLKKAQKYLDAFQDKLSQVTFARTD